MEKNTTNQNELKTEDESKNDSGNFSDTVRSGSANGTDISMEKSADEECWHEVSYALFMASTLLAQLNETKKLLQKNGIRTIFTGVMCMAPIIT